MLSLRSVLETRVDEKAAKKRKPKGETAAAGAEGGAS